MSRRGPWWSSGPDLPFATSNGAGIAGPVFMSPDILGLEFQHAAVARPEYRERPAIERGHPPDRQPLCGRVNVAPSVALRVFNPRARWPRDARRSGFVQAQMK